MEKKVFLSMSTIFFHKAQASWNYVLSVSSRAINNILIIKKDVVLNLRTFE